jgi:hypothetical protein
MGRNVRACGKNSGGLGNRAKFSKMLAHSYEVGSGPILLLAPFVLKRQLHGFDESMIEVQDRPECLESSSCA